MEFNLKMVIHRVATLLNLFLLSFLYAGDCSCCITEDYFNESILSYHITILNKNLGSIQPVLYRYGLHTVDCEGDLTISIEYKIIAPEIGLNTFETFYKGSISINSDSPLNYFTNNQIESGFIPDISSNNKMETLVSYISQTGKLPNGKYLFNFTLNSDADPNSASKVIDIQVPQTLELLSPGGSLSELYRSYTHSSEPIFTWYSDYCQNCEFAIRVCEYNQDDHESLEDAMSAWSLVPIDQLEKYHKVGWNTHSYQYPSVGHINLEVEKFYVWQIRRSFDTTLGIHHDFSPINIFEIRAPDQLQLDYVDSYLSVIESIIGEDQFNRWFNNGGELEGFTTTGNLIWKNDEEIHIETLYSILSELKQNKISIKDISLK